MRVIMGTMSIIIFYILSSVLLVSAISLLGIFFIFIKDRLLKEITFLLISLAVGALLGGATLHLLPDIFSKESNDSLAIALLFGVFSFFTLEKFLHWHHEHSVHAIKNTECTSCGKQLNTHPEPLGHMVLFSDALHNLLDGALIAAAFFVSPSAGVATTIAMLLHEIPQEIADFGILLHAGFTKTRALLFNFISALTAFIGAIMVIFAKEWSERTIPYFTAFAAGSLLYIAMADLIPELHKQKSKLHLLKQMLMILFGILLMLALKMLEV